ncbi:hypothetical protein BO221_27680 [Archangium sp. Cb G35]|uniref:hypothetical protein n=1 Tax=Archangium sp. Cb G35 TaxID=1920190 RepID=UPI0009377485|nr:hypothetical protein [Archangium sp. Cb G35]OJT21589.1 hypothetical protein BO221_27680 [Archangium sp. Cb G35]
MKLLGRIAGVLCWAALVGCGVEEPVTETVEDTGTQQLPVTCPQLVPPGPGFCEFGTIVPVYDGKCIVSYRCETQPAGIAPGTCPDLVPPGPGFCEFGTIVPVYDSNKCIVSYRCI